MSLAPTAVWSVIVRFFGGFLELVVCVLNIISMSMERIYCRSLTTERYLQELSVPRNNLVATRQVHQCYLPMCVYPPRGLLNLDKGGTLKRDVGIDAVFSPFAVPVCVYLSKSTIMNVWCIRGRKISLLCWVSGSNMFYVLWQNKVAKGSSIFPRYR